AVGAERHVGDARRVGEQDAVLLLPGQQRCHGGAGLGGGEDTPGGNGKPPRGHGIEGVNAEALEGEFTRKRHAVLPAGVGGVSHGYPCGYDGQDEGEGARDRCVAPARGASLSAAADVEEVLFGRAERRVAGGVGGDPGGGAGGGLEQGAAVEVGRVAGVAGPVGGGGVQPGAGDPVGAG